MSDKKITVKQLKQLLEKSPDNARVVIDTEARLFQAHLYDLNSAYFESEKDIGEDMFILYPDYSGTLHINLENIYKECKLLKQAFGSTLLKSTSENSFLLT